METYHKIQTIFKRDPETNHKTLLENEYSLPEFEYLKNNEWVFTEKVDGTNIRVMFDGDEIRYNGKTDKAQTPFDLIEAESEIVSGFHIEYGGMKFGMFFLAEFVNTLFMSALFSTVFLGGWNIPIINLILGFFGVTPIDLNALAFGRVIGLVIFFTKTFSIYFVFIWIRATWPRVRVDQMLSFNWKFLVPISL